MHVSQVCRTYAELCRPDSSSREHSVSGYERSQSCEGFTKSEHESFLHTSTLRKKYVHLRDKTAIET